MCDEDESVRQPHAEGADRREDLNESLVPSCPHTGSDRAESTSGSEEKCTDEEGGRHFSVFVIYDIYRLKFFFFSKEGNTDDGKMELNKKKLIYMNEIAVKF